MTAWTVLVACIMLAYVYFFSLGHFVLSALITYIVEAWAIRNSVSSYDSAVPMLSYIVEALAFYGHRFCCHKNFLLLLFFLCQLTYLKWYQADNSAYF
jgi:hypothetical protein